MTRINCIPVQELTDKHLCGEWKELRRVFSGALRWHNNGRSTSIPSTYRMGAGHVTFFFNKLGYCYARHRQLEKEMRRRNFAANAVCIPVLHLLPLDLFCGWQPDEAAIAINRARIAERHAEGKGLS